MLERNEESTLEEEPTLSIDEQVDEENQKADSHNDMLSYAELSKMKAFNANRICNDLIDMYT